MKEWNAALNELQSEVHIGPELVLAHNEVQQKIERSGLLNSEAVPLEDVSLQRVQLLD